MLRTKRIYEPSAKDDGYRLLVMRLWPRGVRKDSVDSWEPNLGPSRDLLQAFQKGHIDWENLARRYLGEMEEQQPLLEHYGELSRSQTLPLLCSCVDELRCHRTLLRGLLEQS
jgi:uncharacterized protein YeaO (DUF488 family)